MNMATYELIDNAAAQRYEFRFPEGPAMLDYEKVSHGEILLTHTEVPPGLQGRGIGGALIVAALEDIERQGLKVIPICGFVETYIERHPQWRRILPEGMEM